MRSNTTAELPATLARRSEQRRRSSGPRLHGWQPRNERGNGLAPRRGSHSESSRVPGRAWIDHVRDGRSIWCFSRDQPLRPGRSWFQPGDWNNGRRTDLQNARRPAERNRRCSRLGRLSLSLLWRGGSRARAAGREIRLAVGIPTIELRSPTSERRALRDRVEAHVRRARGDTSWPCYSPKHMTLDPTASAMNCWPPTVNVMGEVLIVAFKGKRHNGFPSRSSTAAK
jgi:hypothetical protein